MTVFKKKLVTIALVLPLSFSTWAANNGPGDMQAGMSGGMQGGMMGHEESCQLTADQIQLQTLSQDVIDSLKFMYEEEKLARDVYQTLYLQWFAQEFDNISASEQKHMDSIKVFLDAYGIEDPASEVTGEFNNADLQALYNQLIEQGAASLIEAYKVGALVEEVDIADLQDAIANTDIVELKAMYSKLLNASHKHLRAFTRQIILIDGSYTAQEMPQLEVDEILAATSSHMMQMGNSNQVGGNGDNTASACFTSSLSADQQMLQNGSHFNASQSVNIEYQVNVDTMDVGETADWVVVASYAATPSSPVSWFVRNADQWQDWDGQVATLPAAMVGSELQSEHTIPVFEGVMEGLQGGYSIYVGYRLADNRLVYNQYPLVFSVNP